MAGVGLEIQTPAWLWFTVRFTTSPGSEMSDTLIVQDAAFVGFEVCFSVKPTSSQIQHCMQYNFTWSEYTLRIYFYIKESLLSTHSSRLIFFSNDASLDICLHSGRFWSCCPLYFPFVPLCSALWMTSTPELCVLFCDELGSFMYPRELPVQRAEQPCPNIWPCSLTKQHPLIQHAQHFYM